MPNELCVGVFRARNLAVKDKGIVGKGSSDPYVKLKVAGTTLERRTKVKKTTDDLVAMLQKQQEGYAQSARVLRTKSHWMRTRRELVGRRVLARLGPSGQVGVLPTPPDRTGWPGPYLARYGRKRPAPKPREKTIGAFPVAAVVKECCPGGPWV